MKFRLSIFLLISCFFATLSVSAQETVDQQLQMITNQNGTVNGEIGEGKYYLHRLTLNAGYDKIWGNVSKYQENINFYFDINNGQAVLRKVIVSADIANRQAYSDYLYDPISGALWLGYTTFDVTKPEQSLRYHFFNKQLISAYFDGKKEDATVITTEDAQKGSDILEKANAYKKAFDTLIKLQVTPSK